MLNNIRRMAMALALVVIMVTLGACGGGNDAPTATLNADGTVSSTKTDSINIYLCAAYVNDEAAQAYVKELSDSVDALGDASVKLNLTTISTGDGADPTMQMGSIMKLSAAIAAREVDIVIADEDNAARNARGETFYALSSLLTSEEISALGDRALSYDMLNDEGKTTGEKTAACGIDVTGAEKLKPIFGDTKLGVFVVGNAPNLENAKAVLREIISQPITTATGGAQPVGDSGDAQAQTELGEAVTG